MRVAVSLAVPSQDAPGAAAPVAAPGVLKGARMSSDVVVRSGGVSIELDREVGVALLVCDRHRVQDAIPLERETLGVLMVDFFTRHERCASTASTVALARSR